MKNRLLNGIIGAINNRDEYQRQEIHQQLAFSGILLWGLTMILMMISLVIDTMHHTLTFLTPALLIINMVYAFTTISKLQKKHVLDTDCATLEEYNEKKKYLKRSAILAAVMWSIFMLVCMQYIYPYLSSGAINVS